MEAGLRRELTPKQRVLKKYPGAVCETNGPFHQIVVVGKYATAHVLGMVMHGTPRDAWAAAAWNMER